MSKKFSMMFLIAMLLGGALAACDREGPAEKAGEAVDKAVENTGDAVKDATN